MQTKDLQTQADSILQKTDLGQLISSIIDQHQIYDTFVDLYVTDFTRMVYRSTSSDSEIAHEEYMVRLIYHVYSWKSSF